MIKKTLLTAAAVATLAAGTLAGPSNADAGFNISIGNYGHGTGYGAPGYGHGYGQGYGRGRYYGGWYGSRHNYRPYRQHCRWKKRKVRVRYWDAYRNCWVTKKVRRRYRVCY